LESVQEPKGEKWCFETVSSFFCLQLISSSTIVLELTTFLLPLPCNVCLPLQAQGHFLRDITAGQPQLKKKKKNTSPRANRITRVALNFLANLPRVGDDIAWAGRSLPLSSVAHAPNVGILLEDNGAVAGRQRHAQRPSPRPKAGTQRHLT
jgi:hypothetical protein